MKAKDMLLADALKSAIETKKSYILIKRWLIASLCLNGVLLAIVGVLL